MDIPVNHLKHNLNAGKVQTGCWVSLASHASAEICAGAGFDWVLIDMEHAPNELHMVHHQLHAASAYPASVLVRRLGALTPAQLTQVEDAVKRWLGFV